MLAFVALTLFALDNCEGWEKVESAGLTDGALVSLLLSPILRLTLSLYPSHFFRTCHESGRAGFQVQLV